MIIQQHVDHVKLKMKECPDWKYSVISIIHRRFLSLMLKHGAHYTSPCFMIANNECEFIDIVIIVLLNIKQLRIQTINDCLRALIGTLVDYQIHGNEHCLLEFQLIQSWR